MSEIVAAVPDEFLLLSGDDSHRRGGDGRSAARGLISVASNAVPAEMVQIIELAEKGDFAAARRLHHWLLPFLQVNFVESNPIPVKAAMAAMGLIEERVPPAARPARPRGARQDHEGAAGSQAARLRGPRVTRPFASIASARRTEQPWRWIRSRWRARLIDIDSTTGREGDAGAWLARLLRERGYQVVEAAGGGRPLQRLRLASMRRPPVVFSTHFDCVPPFFPSREERGLLFGRGSCDAKGILAAQIAAAERLRARRRDARRAAVRRGRGAGQRRRAGRRSLTRRKACDT